MTDALAAHCEAWSDRPWNWGVSDCMLFVAEYFSAVTGHDAAAAFRGRYRDEDEARAAIEAAGGLVQIVANAAQQAGWSPLRGICQAPRGAIGVVRVRSDLEPMAVGAIAAGGPHVLIFTGGQIIATPGVLLRGWAP